MKATALALIVLVCAAASAEPAGFAQKPSIEKKGDGYVISFAAKKECDATVAVVAPDGHDPHREPGRHQGKSHLSRHVAPP